MTTASRSLPAASSACTWKELHSADFTFNAPFTLQLSDDQALHADEVVRMVPKRRMVVFGTWQGKAIVAKLFLDKKRAATHIAKELNGVRALQDNKIPTPAVLFQGESQDKKIQVLIFERIFNAESLDACWQASQHESLRELFYLLQPVIIEIATQHVLGVLQHDMHLKNFLMTDKVIYTLDGGQIQLTPHLLPKKPSMESLALFLSQLGVGKEPLQAHLFEFYAKARGWLVKPQDRRELFHAIKRWNNSRWLHFDKKIKRNSTEFASLKKWQKVGMYNRQYKTPAFLDFLQHPEMAFTHESTQFLKKGRSSTVVKVTLDGRDYVVKRYNLKNTWHRLRRALRATRAAACWQLAHKMQLFGIATAKPVAYLEARWMGLRGQSYYVTEYVPGVHAGDYFASPHSAIEEDTMVAHVVTLLKNLSKIDMSHGDLKITNILIDKNQQPVLIDLDGAQQHDSLASLRYAWHKEIKRFLQNFDDQPPLKAKFENALLNADEAAK